MKRLILLVFFIATGLSWVNQAQAQSGRVEFNGHEYEYVQQYMLWTDARSYAESMGGYLVCITDESENGFVANLVGGACVWIGATDEAVNLTWEWISGEPFVYTAWRTGEPTDGGEDYGSIGYASLDRWNDFPNAAPNDVVGFVIEYSSQVDQSDGWIRYNGHEYKYFSMSITWPQAKLSAESMGGYLVCINDADEQQFLYDHFNNEDDYWAGGSDSNVEGHWEWLDGSPFSFSNWYPGEPNNSGDEDVLHVWSSVGSQWNDLAIHRSLNGFVVERVVTSFTSESFNHSGALPDGWTVESQGRSTPWTPVQEDGEDWAIESSHTAYDGLFNEVLISPVYDLTWWEDVQAGFNHNYTHAGSQASFRSSATGGLSWTETAGWSFSAAGDTLVDLPSSFNGNDNARFSFVFTGDLPTDGASWRVDDFYLTGTPRPPVAFEPVPNQASAFWTTLSGNLGCSFYHPLSVMGDSLELRVDMNGDGDYLDGGEEDWTLLTAFASADSLELLVPHSFSSAGLFRFEFRAKTANSRWGYSGTAGLEGISDDWQVIVFVSPPVIGSPLPSQPPAEWISLTGSIGCTVTHATALHGDSLYVRVDMDGDGSYSGEGAEAWTLLPAQPDSTTLVVSQEVSFAGNGQYAFEFKARAVDGLWAWSGTASG